MRNRLLRPGDRLLQVHHIHFPLVSLLGGWGAAAVDHLKGLNCCQHLASL